MAFSLHRRQFLHGLLAGAATSTVSKTALAQASPQVIVVGAGPAGFSAAIELAERGVSVLLLEAGSQVGGKVKGWKGTIQGDAVDVEHGIHGWWYQYVHFRDLLERTNLSHHLRPFSFREASMKTPEKSLNNFFTRAFDLIRQAKARGFRKIPARFRSDITILRELSRERIIESLGGLSVHQWLERRDMVTVFSMYPEMMAYSMYFDAPENIEAAAFLIGERFYFSGGKNNGDVNWLKGNPQTLVWEPLHAKLKSLGAKVRLSSPVSELIVEEGKVKGVRMGSLPEIVPVPQFESTTQVRGPKGPIFVERSEDGTLLAWDGRCTHMGCPVNKSPTGFSCPCHGGQYDSNGVPQSGPPKAKLRSLDCLQNDDGSVQVVFSEEREEIYADHVILAVDVPSLKVLAEPVLPQTAHLKGLREIVARFWFDKDVKRSPKKTVLLDGYAHSNNAFLVHRLQDESKNWAKKNGGSVIEIQAFKDIPPEGTADEILDMIEAEVRLVWPELSEAKALKRHLTDNHSFTHFHPRWRKGALSVDPSVDGLFLAGDYLDVDSDAQFMELAVLTGRMAANSILKKLDKPTAPILPPR